MGDLGAARRACDQALKSAKRFGEARVVAEVEAKHAFLAYHAGEWETAREITRRYANTPDRWVWYDWCIWVHGLIAIADGDDEAAHNESHAMKEFYVHAGRALDALMAKAGARTADASAAAHEAIAGTEGNSGFKEAAMFAAVELIAIPSTHEPLKNLARRLPDDNHWKRAVNTISTGRYADAANIFEEMGSQSLAARAHTLASDHANRNRDPEEAKRHAEQALAFYRKVAASRYADHTAELLAVAARSQSV